MHNVRRTLLSLAALGLLAASMAGAQNVNYVNNRAPLARTAFIPLPLGSIRPQGWLLEQLKNQKGGLTGNAEAIYPELGPDSNWLNGGKAPDSDWERPTYYMRGLIPLAYSMGDPELIAKAKKWMDGVIKSQRPDGTMGPAGNGDWWARMPALTAIEDYYEASGDKRVIPFLTNYFHYQLKNTPDGLGYWGAARAADNIQAVLWLYNRTGDQQLLALVDKIRKITEDWTTALLTGGFGDNHGVNVAEGFKMPPVWYQRSLAKEDRDAFLAGQYNAERIHGQPHDLPSCTEFLAGKSSLQGVELCSIVDRIFSDGIASMVLGDPKIGDVTEKIAFNALPGGTSRNMHQHQYYIVPNQAQNVFGPKGIYGQDYENALCPSTRSGVPCCCFNWHMGWPKFVQYTWAATPDNGLAVITYAPTVVTAKVGNGTSVKVTEETNYPFDEQIKLKISVAKPVKFPLMLRIPEWCRKPVVKVDGAVQTNVSPAKYCTVNRVWKNGDVVVLTFPMELKATTQIRDSVAIERGPLVYSLSIGEKWEKRVPFTAAGQDFSEYEVKPTTDWNYALVIDRDNLAATIKVNKKPMPANPFLKDASPITLTVKAMKVPAWTMAKNNLPEEVPQSPVDPKTAVENVTLVPFGAENIRITYFPVASSVQRPSGLTGEYFNGSDMGTPRTKRTDQGVNFRWGTAAPDPAVQPASFSARWTGQIKPRITGTIRFYLTADDGARMWVDGKPVIANWAGGSGKTVSGTIALTAGKWYDIRVEYTKTDYLGSVVLEWAGTGQPREVVPSTCLRPMEAANLEASFNFDDGTGKVARDSSGSGRTADLSLPSLWSADGKTGSCVAMNGATDKVALPDLPECNTVTIAAWVNMSELPVSGAAIVTGDKTPCLGIMPGGALYFSPKKSLSDPVESTEAGLQSQYRFAESDISQWHHVAVTYSGYSHDTKIYIDGFPDAAGEVNSPNPMSLTGMRLGQGAPLAIGSFRGRIDDVRIYSRCLADSEVAEMVGQVATRGLRSESYSDEALTKLDKVSFVPNIFSAVPYGNQEIVHMRWVGSVRPRYSEDYTLLLTSGVKARLWVDGKLVIDNWTNGAKKGTANVKLEAGRLYDLKLECSGTLEGMVALEWSSESQKSELIPAGCLYAPTDAPTPSVAWYKFDKTDAGTDVKDSSGNGRDAKISGECDVVPGKFDSAIGLTGRDGFISLPQGIVKDCKDITAASWVKVNRGRGWSRLFDFGTGPEASMFLSVAAGPGLRFAITNNRTRGEQRIDAPVRLESGDWRHVAVTVHENVGILYVDGLEVARTAGLTLNPAGMGDTAQNYIGKSQYGVDPNLDAQVDDFRIYNWALSPENIKAIAQAARQ